MPNKQIELRIEGSSIVVKCPPDRELIADIKVIPVPQRKWADPEWIVALHDPDQKADEKTNLEYIITVCAKAAVRLDWEFKNYAGNSDEEIELDKAKTQEQSINEFLAAVDQLPHAGLKLIRWHSDRLQLQLNSYLSDDHGGYELFMKLYRASVEAYKPGMLLMSHNERADFGFIFTLPYRDKIIRKLIDKGTTYLKKIQLSPIQFFEDQIVHFHNSAGELWVGVPMEKSDPGSLNWDYRDWQLTWHEDTLYWVVEAKCYVYAWLEESTYSVARFGGAFGVIFERPNTFPEKMIGFHLEDWLSDHIDAIALLPPTCRAQRPHSYRVSAWDHPIDKFLAKVEIVSEIKESVEHQKQELAKSSVESDRTNAIKIAKDALDYKYDKAEIVARYKNQISGFKPSWTKKKILEILCTQEFSEEYLEIKKVITTE